MGRATVCGECSPGLAEKIFDCITIHCMRDLIIPIYTHPVE